MIKHPCPTCKSTEVSYDHKDFSLTEYAGDPDRETTDVLARFVTAACRKCGCGFKYTDTTGGEEWMERWR